MTDLLQTAITTWMLIGVAIAVVIRLTAGPLAAYWVRIPEPWRPLVAGLVGMLGACAESLVAGRTWREALLALAVTSLIPGLHAAQSSVTPKTEQPTTPPTV